MIYKPRDPSQLRSRKGMASDCSAEEDEPKSVLYDGEKGLRIKTPNSTAVRMSLRLDRSKDRSNLRA